MPNVNNNIAAVIVAYHSKKEHLESILERLDQQVKFVFIVDNTPESMELETLNSCFCNITSLKDNLGIACAQNIGIKKAISEGFKEILLLDDDSLPSKTMVDDLLLTRGNAEHNGLKVGAVGPLPISSHHNEPDGFTVPNGLKLSIIKSPLKHSDNYCEASFLIASGSLISVNTLEKVGLMREDFFIDCVDFEWCFKARSMGLSTIGAFNATMSHTLGDKPLKIFGRNLTVHSPLRHYYFFRNLYRLIFSSTTPKRYKLFFVYKSIIIAGIFAIYGKPRTKHIKMIILGLFHSLTGKMGKLNEE